VVSSGGELRPATPYFLFVGTLEPRKNLPALVEAWREVRRHHPVELVLAGRRRADFPALAEEPGLRLIGEVADEKLPQLYSGALAFVYPSLYEGFGLPVLEAMQCGAPVIASRAVAEAAGDAAVYADTPQELARAMREAAARPEWRAEIGARSVARAREFSWERTARMTHEVTRRPGGVLATEARASALVLAPEAPYPLAGGGALRTASLLHYLAIGYDVDLVVFRQPGAPDPGQQLPAGLVRRVWVVDLPAHGRSFTARAVRNALRVARGVPPLVDRFAGFGREIEQALEGRRYDIGLVEHFWCAPYGEQVGRVCGRTVLDLHNIESVLDQRCAEVEGGARAWAHRVFSRASLKLERTWLPRFSEVLAASENDAERARAIAPGARVTVYPNALPSTPLPARGNEDAIVFSGNMEYHPNISAVRFFRREVWPLLRERWPGLVWRLIGKNPEAVRRFTSGDARIQVEGPVEDAIRELARAKVAVVPVLAG
jgi:hypothetical protein